MFLNRLTLCYKQSVNLFKNIHYYPLKELIKDIYYYCLIDVDILVIEGEAINVVYCYLVLLCVIPSLALPYDLGLGCVVCSL